MPDVAATVQAAARTVAVARGATVRVQAGVQAEVEASPTMLRQAIENLIDNAAAHGGPDGVEVDVRADPAAGQVEVVVADRGGGRRRPQRPRHRAVRGPPVPRRGRGPLLGGAPGGRRHPGRAAHCRCGRTPNRIHWTSPSTPDRRLSGGSGNAATGPGRPGRRPRRLRRGPWHGPVGRGRPGDRRPGRRRRLDPPGGPDPPPRRAGGRHRDARPGRHRAGPPGRPGRAGDPGAAAGRGRPPRPASTWPSTPA